MNRKIFTTDESRIRLDLSFEPYYLWLRSADSNDSRYAGYVFYNGGVGRGGNVCSRLGTAFACTI